MGEVYRARDTKLNRDVALKILPEAFATDAERLARFRREAQMLASLNHPHIGHIYGFEDRGATHALVLELVEGPTLADRMRPGPMALVDAVPIATQIAEALEAAHELGIVHRDLKPANVKVRDDGTVKVLDFGLAKAIDPATMSSADAMHAPTMTSPAMTSMGVILGTAAYMAPEQARGQAVDKRADIWAFGVVLFEMITGQPAFKGNTVADVLAAVLRGEIAWSALPTGTPQAVRRLLRRCLERDPRRRLRDIGDARIDLRADPSDEPEAGPSSVATRRAGPLARWLPWVVAAALFGSAGFALGRLRTPSSPPRIVTRAEVTLKDGVQLVNVSRDGSEFVYLTGTPPQVYLALRRLDQFAATPITHAEVSLFPLLSPDGRWVAYNTLGPTKEPVIKKMPAMGGPAVTVCDGDLAPGAAWGDDDTIVFSGAKGLLLVPSGGGTPQPLTTVDPAKGEAAHTSPQFLPGGRQLLFTITSTTSDDARQFAVLDLATGGYRTVAKGGVSGRYVASGHLTYIKGATLFAVPFDLGHLTVTGDEVPMIEGVRLVSGRADYSVSNSGLLVYVPGDPSPGGGTTLAWVNRQGATEALSGQSRQRWGSGRLSPDGRKFVSSVADGQGGEDIWIFDVQRGTPTRLTFSGHAYSPIWAPDGKVVYFVTQEQLTKSEIYSIPADGSGKPDLLVTADRAATPRSFTPDGRTLLYDAIPAGERVSRIFVLQVAASGPLGTPHPWHDTTALERDAQVSPDGRWVAYRVECEAGFSEIYVQTFPGTGAKTRLSTLGGNRPRWARNGCGKELLLIKLGRFGSTTAGLVAVEIQSDPTFKPGAPRELFPLRGGTWDVTPDSDRFLVELTPFGGASSTVATVTDWFEELRRRAPARR